MENQATQSADIRPYRRISAEEWEKQKPHISALYVDQDRPLEEVIEMMKANHGFDSNEKAYKRKMKIWGMTKNIPRSEMLAMAKKEKTRMDRQQKKTKFERRGKNGEFQPVSTEKLENFKRRLGARAISALSPSSIPSNLLYRTPSNTDCSSTSSNNMDRPEDQNKTKAKEFNDEFNRLWTKQTAGPNSWKPISRVEYGGAGQNTHWSTAEYNMHDSHACLDAGHALLFEGDYQASITLLESAKEGYSHILGEKHWLAVVAGFEAEMVKLATDDSYPRELDHRIKQLLFRHHATLRWNYIQVVGAKIGSFDELKKHLVSLRAVIDYWRMVLMVQSGLKMWDFLGPQNKFLLAGRSAIEELRSKWQQSIELEHVNVDSNGIGRNSNGIGRNSNGIGRDSNEIGRDSNGIGRVFTSMNKLADMKLPKEEGSFYDLCDRDQDILRLKLKALLSMDGSQSHNKTLDEVTSLFWARHKTCAGAHHSFVGNLTAAEAYFQYGHELLEAENSPELKLQRLLWYAEHKTRMKDWTAAQRLLDNAQQVFSSIRQGSEYITNHFRGCEGLLSRSIREMASIDETMQRVELERLEDLRTTGEPSPSADTPMSTHSEWAYSDEIDDLKRSLLQGFDFSVSPLAAGMSEEEWQQFINDIPPPLSLSPGPCITPMQPGTPVDVPNDYWILSPTGSPKRNTNEQQPSVDAEMSNASNEPVIQSPTGSPSGRIDSPMEYDLEAQE